MEWASEITEAVASFDPTLPIERALTPPASWYTEPGFAELDRQAVFARNWVCAGTLADLRETGCYIAGELLGISWLVVRDGDGGLRGFHNVCRHHAAQLVDGEGCVERLRCPYHGWTYGLTGELLFAPKIVGIEDFDRADYGLRSLPVASWGPLVFVWLGDGPPRVEPARELAALGQELDGLDWTGLLRHERRSYDVACDWKVFCDNYLDGGYHIEVAHPGLHAELDPAAYRIEVDERYSVQRSRPRASNDRPMQHRIDGGAVYAFVYPNLCINRYGTIMDSNLVVPTGPGRCKVVFDYFFADVDGPEAEAFIADSVNQSEQVQREDAWLSERVQRGLRSPAYDRGRYAPRLEMAELQFHRLLHADYRAGM